MADAAAVVFKNATHELDVLLECNKFSKIKAAAKGGEDVAKAKAAAKGGEEEVTEASVMMAMGMPGMPDYVYGTTCAESTRICTTGADKTCEVMRRKITCTDVEYDIVSETLWQNYLSQPNAEGLKKGVKAFANHCTSEVVPNCTDCKEQKHEVPEVLSAREDGVTDVSSDINIKANVKAEIDTTSNAANIRILLKETFGVGSETAEKYNIFFKMDNVETKAPVDAKEKMDYWWLAGEVEKLLLDEKKAAVVNANTSNQKCTLDPTKVVAEGDKKMLECKTLMA